MYAERLPSGQWGVYLDSGRRIAVCYTKAEAVRKIALLQKKGK